MTRSIIWKLCRIGPRRLNGWKLLWIDIHEGSEFSADEVASTLELDDQTKECLATPNKQACFNDYGRYIHVTTYAPREESEGELHAALEINDPEIIGHVYVTPKVAALIPCYCCGLTLDEGGK